MARRWVELKRTVSRWATNVGAVVSNTASLIIRRSQRQVGTISTVDPILVCQLNKYEDDLDQIPDTFDSQDRISVGSSVSAGPEDFSSVLLIPYDCRVIIYDFVSFADILNLRLACKQIFYELNYCRGIRLRLDDTVAGYDRFRNTGVGSLIVRHFRSDHPDNYGLLKRPQLLKELVITGSISPDNFSWIVTICPNIRKFAVEISPYTVRYGFQSFFRDTLMPGNLSTLRLSAFMYDHRDAENTGDNFFPILNNVRCPALRQFVFQLVIIDSQSLDSFHIEALKFIRSHSSSLKVLHIQIKQVFVGVSLPSEDDSLASMFSKWVDSLQLGELRLTLDRHIIKWLPILQAQTRLASLELNLRSFSWTILLPVIKQCSASLKNIQVYNLNVREGHRIHPIDLGVLRHCDSLQKLTIHHQEHSPIFHPKISRTAYLPCSLTEIDISRILVKQHQMLFILIRLPRLRKLELAYWICLTDLRRKFENHKSELTRLTNFLSGLATVKTSDAVRETRVTVEHWNVHAEYLQTSVETVFIPSFLSCKVGLLSVNIKREASSEQIVFVMQGEIRAVADLESNTHPLLIDVVLKTVVRLVPRCAIPQCRLVCKKWNYFFISRFSSEFTVNLTEWKSLEKFVDLLYNCQEIPYTRFHISRISMNNPSVEIIFELCGNQMCHLSLELAKDDIDICQFREVLLQRAPNLKELSFDTHDGLPEEVTNHPKLFPSWCQPQLKLQKISLRFSSGKKFATDFLKDLFKSSPLKEVNFRRLIDGDSKTTFALMALKEANPWGSLSSLNLGQIENSALKCLASLEECGIHLKIFSFEYLIADVQAETVEQFLVSQAENLEELTLNEYLGNEHLTIKFPAMPNLRKLAITAFDKSQILPHEPFSYVSLFPAMNTLAVYGWQNMIPWDVFFSEVNNPEPLECLTTLQPPYRMNNVEFFRKLVYLFPNVKSLDITSPSNIILTELWSGWMKLQVLDIFLDWNNTNVDAVFTGISLTDCDRIRKNRIFVEAQEFSLKTSSSLCNLKHLRKFVCEIYEPWRDGEPEAEDPTCLLTDITGYGAFLHMSHLQNIFIARSEISKECVQIIAEELPIYTSIDIRGPRRQKLQISML
ncbi:unnamed protein product [Allacma fusca]|uniref:F-box domain-containing protein n=1 Tax=Allacma fusca TaxID=39272 RepID=A0A8J2LIS7_9HEXA|nr:unnamed protein product [Allacma fusca]